MLNSLYSASDARSYRRVKRPALSVRRAAQGRVRFYTDPYHRRFGWRAEGRGEFFMSKNAR